MYKTNKTDTFSHYVLTFFVDKEMSPSALVSNKHIFSDKVVTIYICTVYIYTCIPHY